MMQPALLPGLPPIFDGETFEPAIDTERLHNQLWRVREFLSDHTWHTLAQIHAAVGGSEAGVSARIRDLRKPRFGGYVIERERVEGGLFRYRLVPHA